MRSPAALGVLVLLALAACGGSSPSPESVVRAWNQALNGGDNERAASLFAPRARVIQGGRVLTLATRAQAVAWNAALPCAGKIVALATRADTATATFVLSHRATRRCDGPGQKATAMFRVREGKIVLWHQLERADGERALEAVSRL